VDARLQRGTAAISPAAAERLAFSRWQLVTLNSASLPVGTPAANGSAATTAGTAVTGTISTAWVPGTISYLGVKYTQATYGGTSPAFAIVDIDYFHGRGSA
jgi:hypothetical protein